MSEMLLLGRGGQGESRDVYLQCFIEKSRGLKYCGIVKFRGPPKLWKLMKRIKIKNPQQTNAVVMSFASEFISTGASVVFQIPEKQTQEVGVASVIAEGLSGFFFFFCFPALHGDYQQSQSKMLHVNQTQSSSNAVIHCTSEESRVSVCRY